MDIVGTLKTLLTPADLQMLAQRNEEFDPMNNGHHIVMAMTGLMQEGWQLTHTMAVTSNGLEFYCYALHAESLQVITHGGTDDFYSAVIGTLMKVSINANYHH